GEGLDYAGEAVACGGEGADGRHCRLLLFRAAPLRLDGDRKAGGARPAPVGPQRSGGRLAEDFLVSRGMRTAQGKKVAGRRRGKRSRRSRPSAQISPFEAAWARTERTGRRRDGARWPCAGNPWACKIPRSGANGGKDFDRENKRSSAPIAPGRHRPEPFG